MPTNPPDPMASNLLKGNLDLILLATLESESKYGLEIIKDVQDRTNGHFQFKEGTLYPALHRLEKQGFIQGEFRYLPRGGSPVKFYQLSTSGQQELETRRKTFNTFTKAVQNLLGDTRMLGRLYEP